MNWVCKSGESADQCGLRVIAEQDAFMRTLEQKHGPIPPPDYSDNLEAVGVIVFFVVVLYLFWRL
jgi:hypothetical protein